MIHGRTRLINALLLVAPFFVEGAQAQAHPRQLAKGSPTSSPTSTSTSITPTASFSILETFPQPTTCGSSRIRWIYTGAATSLSLQVSNVGVQDNSSSSTSSSDDTETSIVGRSMPHILAASSDITVTIATNLTPSSRAFIWDPVNVPDGQYIISALAPGVVLTQSLSTFSVLAGTDTSCLAATTSSTTSASTTPITSSSVNSMASQSPASSTSQPTTSNHVNVPVIVGVTVGTAAFVMAVIAIWLCLYRKAKSHRRSGPLNNFAHRWNGLGSADSRAGFAAKATKQNYQSSRSHLHSHPESVASTMGPDFDGAVAEKHASHLNNGKTSPLSDEQGVALSTLPVLHHQSPRTRPTRTHSESSSASINYGAKPSVQRSRRPSLDTPSSYPPSSPISPQYAVAPNMTHSHSMSSTQHSSSHSTSTPLSSSPPPPPPISPSAAASREIKQMNRQSLGRRRKPVPVYNPDQEHYQQPESATSLNFAPPLPPSPTTNGDSAGIPSLIHKSSFGPGGIEGRPLHYLIPDMPISSVNP